MILSLFPKHKTIFTSTRYDTIISRLLHGTNVISDIIACCLTFCLCWKH